MASGNVSIFVFFWGTHIHENGFCIGFEFFYANVDIGLLPKI